MTLSSKEIANSAIEKDYARMIQQTTDYNIASCNANMESEKRLTEKVISRFTDLGVFLGIQHVSAEDDPIHIIQNVMDPETKRMSTKSYTTPADLRWSRHAHRMVLAAASDAPGAYKDDEPAFEEAADGIITEIYHNCMRRMENLAKEHDDNDTYDVNIVNDPDKFQLGFTNHIIRMSNKISMKTRHTSAGWVVMSRDQAALLKDTLYQLDDDQGDLPHIDFADVTPHNIEKLSFAGYLRAYVYGALYVFIDDFRSNDQPVIVGAHGACNQEYNKSNNYRTGLIYIPQRPARVNGVVMDPNTGELIMHFGHSGSFHYMHTKDGGAAEAKDYYRLVHMKGMTNE